MKSLHTRLDDQKDDVLEVVETFGRFRAMSQFQVKDYPGFCKLLRDWGKDENFGLRPKINYTGHQSLGDQLVEAFLRKVANLEAENKRVKQRNDFLEWQLSQQSPVEEHQTLAILQTCEV